MSVRAPLIARSRALLWILGLGLFSLASCQGDNRYAIGRPPILLVVLDALHAEHLGHLGYERDTTPTLDRLAAQGVSFERAFAPAPYTLASIPSLFTGRLPDHHGLVRKHTRLRDGERLLAETLARGGYRTFGAVANPNGGAQWGLDRGFDHFVELYEDLDEDDEMLAGLDAEKFLPVVEGWLALLEEDPLGGPPFFYLHVLEPHSPYSPPEHWREQFLDFDYDGPFARGDNRTLIDSVYGRIAADEDDIRAVRALYDATLRHADDVLGRLFERLDDAGLFGEMLVVITSDHGEALWQRGRWGHNDQLFDEMLRIPLIVRFPLGLGPEGLLIQSQVSLLDVAPSLSEWLDLPAPEHGFDGVSLAELIEDPSRYDPERRLILRTNADLPQLGERSQRAKTIVHLLDERRRERVEHYRFAGDPEERVDRAAEFAGEWAPRVDLLLEWYEQHHQAGAPGRRMGARSQRLLEQLGYMGD